MKHIQILAQTKTERNTSTITGKQRNNRNTEVRQKQTPTYTEMDYLITADIFQTWNRTFEENMVG